ncbi:MAG: NAD(P)/FAD-dependent oxidoreductase [Leptolyngbyaceae cyanobacterium SL_7_1]|nr:NAD(P)/FAD-dependent oxidoreductase [Leptolyngbyaceae cyanobacterium SL_7_1]
MRKRPRIVVIGAGFGGMQAAQSLAKAGVSVLLIDRNPYHTFVPLLYQVATAQLSPDQAIYPLRTLVRRFPHLQFLMADVQEINLAQQWLATSETRISYDYLVLATGSRSQFFTIPGAADYSFPLNTVSDAVVLRNHLFACFERAAQTTDPVEQRSLLTFAIVGGGATGVELAGALGELVRSVQRDYPTIERRNVRIALLQGGTQLLAEFPRSLGNYTAQRLCRLGVEVYLQAKVSRVSPTAVYLDNGMSIPTGTTIWTAGVEAAIPVTSTALDRRHRGRLAVRSTLQLPNDDRVYAIGDAAYSESAGKPLAGVAPEALQQGVAAAKNIQRQLRGTLPQPFHYFNKGRLAIIGGYAAVGRIGKLNLAGIVPWLLWLGVHWVYLPGWRNRLFVLLSWLQNYGLGDRALRIILSLPRSEGRSLSPQLTQQAEELPRS